MGNTLTTAMLLPSSQNPRKRKNRSEWCGAHHWPASVVRANVILLILRGSFQFNHRKAWPIDSQWWCHGTHVPYKGKASKDSHPSVEERDPEWTLCIQQKDNRNARQLDLPSKEDHAQQPFLPQASLPSKAKEEEMIYFHFVSTSLFLYVVNLIVHSYILSLLLYLAHHDTPNLASATDVGSSTGTWACSKGHYSDKPDLEFLGNNLQVNSLVVAVELSYSL